MKTNRIGKWILVLGFLLPLTGIIAQIPTADYYQRLFFLCKAWGHAKYYHTEIAKGLVNWDNELLRAAAAAKNAPTNDAFNDSLLQMLNNAGPMGTSSATLPVIPDSLNNNLDLSWIQDPFLSAGVKNILLDIKNKFRPQKNVYLGPMNNLFTNDSSFYAGENYPSEAKRILAMCRYWNMFQYFYPYKKLMDQDWNITLTEFIPKVVESSDAQSYALNFKEFINHINDSHGIMSSPTYSNWRGSYYTPFQARYIENEMVLSNVLPSATGLAVGDIITDIDGSDIDTTRADNRKYANGSNDPTIEKNLTDIILFGPQGTSQVTVSNGSGPHPVGFTRESSNYSSLNVNNNPAWKTVTRGNYIFGIVDMGKLQINQVDSMFTALWNTHAIIFDIRNYPNGTLWYIVNNIYPGPVRNANFTVPDTTYPGRLHWSLSTIGTGRTDPYDGNLIILFDERTISQAEYTCMGLERFPGSIKIGSTTQGADGNVSPIYLPGNIYTLMTGLGVYYPDYSPTQRIGIIPDYVVKPTIAGIRAGVDEVMEFALNMDVRYCTSSGFNVSSEYIDKITLGTFSNNSGPNGGFGNFISDPIMVQSGSTYNFTLTPVIGKNRRENVKVWIDFNKDGDFTDAGEEVFAANGIRGPVSGNIKILSGISGQTRMRISMKYNAIPTPCEHFVYGEVEDYVLNITAPIILPPVADFTGSPTTLPAGNSVQFTDKSTNNPTSWLWTFEGGTPTASTSQNPLISYNTPGSFGVTLVATNSAGSGTKFIPNYITVTGGTVSYCASHSNSNALEYIGEVVIASFSNSSGPSFYSYFTDKTITLSRGSTSPVTLTPIFINKAQSEYWRIWIDFNADGDFTDAGELVFSANNKRTIVTGTLTIPGTAIGQTRMRICMKNGSAPSPCEVFANGEVEDYPVSFSSINKEQAWSTEQEYQLFPVPVNDLLTLSIPGNTVPVKVRIFNIFGSLMEYFIIETDQKKIDVTRYPTGMYLILINEGEKLIPKKFIKN
ncbi:MAG TPA: GEVED domain-containing protein [Bacteroidales bacterium]|nr:GEVED domain-containing protein [Bacteroidales bacterium]